MLSSQCDVLVEEFEEVIEDWYRNHQEEDLTQFLCANHVLKGKDTSESGQERHGSVCTVCPPSGEVGSTGRERKGRSILWEPDEERPWPQAQEQT